ncbi:MAG: MFS transporter, partial [Pseudomonadota bacterium]
LIWTRVPAGLSFQSSSLRDLGAVLRDGPKMAAIAFTATFLAAIFLLYTYMAPLLSTTMGYGRNEITFILFIFGIGAVAGNILGGIMADRFGSMRTLTGIVFLQLVFMPFYSFLPVPGALLLGWTLIWSSIGWSFGAAQQVRLVELCGAQAPVALALNASAIYVGGAVGSGIGAGVIESAGLGALGIAATLMMLVALANLRLSRRLSGQAPSQPSSSPKASR